MAKESESKSDCSDLNQSVGDAYDKFEQLLYAPPSVARRIKALKKIQSLQTDLESEFYKELHELEKSYNEKYKTYYEQRAKIVTGEYEPNDKECEWKSDDDEENLAADIHKIKLEMKAESEENKLSEKDNETKKKEEDNIKGIPDFWLTIFRNVSMLADNVQEHDDPILKHLYDIKTEYLDSGFKLEFYFSPNEYFTNSVLTKEYTMRFEPDKNDPFSYEGPEIVGAKGCDIDWKKGKNITLKVVKKNQKHKSKGSTRTVTRTVQNDSFFNFFNPPTIPNTPDAKIDEDIQALLTADFEIGHYIRERIIQRAVLYYTGEALEDEDEDYEEEEEDHEEEEEDDLDEDEEVNNSRTENTPEYMPIEY